VRGLAWINTQFSNHSYSFYYVARKPTSVSDFMSLVRIDIYLYVEMDFVRVNLSSGYYGDWRSGGFHATGSTGYNDTAGTVTSYDPYSLRSSNGTCSSPSYGDPTKQTLGCTWTMRQAYYYYAMDKSSGGGLPVWY
jgi:hypothetical protein